MSVVTGNSCFLLTDLYGILLEIWGFRTVVAKPDCGNVGEFQRLQSARVQRGVAVGPSLGSTSLSRGVKVN